jgi:hypothetical protein
MYNIEISEKKKLGEYNKYATSSKTKSKEGIGRTSGEGFSAEYFMGNANAAKARPLSMRIDLLDED